MALLAIDDSGVLAVVDPKHLLSVATRITGFDTTATGLARHPATGSVYVIGFQFGDTDSVLGRLDVNSGQVTTVGHIPGNFFVGIAFDGTGKLYGVTEGGSSHDPNELLRIDASTAMATPVAPLDTHGGGAGALAFNSADGGLYLGGADGQGNLFIDRVSPGTFAQTPVLSPGPAFGASSMAFADGRLWLVGGPFGNTVYSADAADVGAGLVEEGSPTFPSAYGVQAFFVTVILQNADSCVPGPTAACLYRRFKVEVTYDATPGNGSGPANVVLESSQSVKFTFFDPNNIEMILKILNACGLNNKWWVFAGGLTDVGVTINVTDTQSGAVKHYQSAKGKLFQAFADTSAFGCP